MLYQLIKRDPVWKIARWGLPLTAVACAVPNFGALYGPVCVIGALFVAMPHRRATLFEGVLPIPARSLFLARAISIVTSIWLFATAASLSIAIFSGSSVAARITLATAGLCTLAAGVLLSIRVRDLAGPGWTLAVVYLCFPLSFLLDHISALLPPICALAGIALLAGTWRAVPRSFQISAGKPAGDPAALGLPATSLSPRLAWWPVIRSVFSIPYAFYSIFYAFAAVPRLWLSGVFWIAAVWLGTRPNIRWLQTLPVRPRPLLATIVTPLLLLSAAGYFARLHIGRHPKPAPALSVQVFELGAMLAWELIVLLLCVAWDWRRLRQISPKGRLVGLLTTIALPTLGGFLTFFYGDPLHSAVLRAAHALPGGLAAAALSAALLTVLWWALERVFSEAEYTDKPRAPKLLDWY
jgi:hypothetical protein